MGSSNLKTEVSASEFENETQQLDLQSKLRVFGFVQTAHVALTAVGLIAGIAAMGVAADSLSVYNNTHVPAEFLLPLWPENFDIRPTNALVAGSVLVVIASALSLLVSQVQSLRKYAGIRIAGNFAAPAVSLIAALVAMIFFYAVNADDSTYTVQSWTCRWRDVAMLTQPYFGTLCKQSKVGLALIIFLVPLQVVILGISAYLMVLQKQLDTILFQQSSRKSSSPVPS